MIQNLNLFYRKQAAFQNKKGRTLDRKRPSKADVKENFTGWLQPLQIVR